MKYTTIDGQLLKEMFLNSVIEIETNKNLLDALNVYPVPDGDTGTNMSATMISAAKEIKQVKDNDIHIISNAAAMGSLMGARGNSGVIMSQILRGFSKKIKDYDVINTKVFAEALKEGANSAYRAVIKPTEGTMLTVIREAADKALEVSETEEDFLAFLSRVCYESTESLKRTPELLPVLKQAGVVDAGGQGIVFMLQGMMKRLQGNILTLEKVEKIKEPSKTKFDHSDLGEIKFGYCTEFFIRTKNADPDRLKSKLVEYGDSLVVVGDGDIIKVHIHTNKPGTVLDEAIKLGELSHIKIDNMKEQHANTSWVENDTATGNDVPEKDYGIVAVAIGEGLVNIFKDIGTDYVIAGGQTMNASTEIILDAINSVKAKKIFVMPNNKNIIMAAEQAKELTDKNVFVIKTKSIPQGITAILSLNPEATPEENVENMTKAIENVKTGQVTFAVRDTVLNDLPIKEGDIIGIFDKNLVNFGKSVEEVSKNLVDKMIDEGSMLVTVFYGNNLTEEDTAGLREYIESKYSNCDISFNYGGQPLYYYIISVE